MMDLFEPKVPKRYLAGQLFWFMAWIAITSFAVYLKPDPSGHGTHQELGLPPCPSVMFFDRPCPGCGLTTSWTAFVHGNIPFAFHAHALGPPLYLLFTISAFLCIYGWFKGMKLKLDAAVPSRVIMCTAVIFIGFGVARMALSPNFATPHEHWYTYLTTHG